MIRLKKEIKDIIGRCNEQDITVYALGKCVRDDLIGEESLDWDLAVGATMERLVKLFPKGVKINNALRLDFTGEDPEGGVIVDIMVYKESPEECLANQSFTIDAMADNPQLGFLDPYNGRGDLRGKLVRSVSEPSYFFRKNPMAMMDAVVLAAQYDLDIERKTYEGMLENARLLNEMDIVEIRENFCTIINSPNAGKGLRMLAGADMMPAIIGDVATGMNRRQLAQFSALCNNIDKTKRNLKRRLGVFYATIEGKKGEEAMKRMNFHAQTEQNIMDGLYLMEKINFFRTTVDLKDALVAYGPDRYAYMENLAKAQRIVFETSDNKIQMRHALMEDILSKKEPIYVEDLAVDESKLIDAGIPENRAPEILIYLTDIVHRKPSNNEEKALIKIAKKFSRSGFAVKTRRVKWLR